MADTTGTVPISEDPVHQEGIDHIKSHIGETTLVATSAGSSEPVNPTSEVAPTETTSSAVAAEPTTIAEPTPSAASHTETSPAVGGVPPVEAAKPPASNPGVDDPSAGISKDAGGTSSTAHIESPVTAAETTPAATSSTATPTSQKRKSVLGNIKGMFGIGETTGTSEEKKERKRSLADRSKSTTSTTPAAPAPADTTTTQAAGGAPGETATDSTAAQAEEAAAENKVVDPTKDESMPGADMKSPSEDAPKGDAADAPAAKEGQSNKHQTLENPEAIPVAGGQKLGEEHWGESKIVPADPLAKSSGVASEAGQPTSEVKDNTAKNTGSATAPGEKKKESFVDKMKDKLKIGKKDK